MESWYQNIVPSEDVWTRHRHSTPSLIPSLVWVQDSRSSGTRALFLIGALGQQCLTSAKRVHGQAVDRWTYIRTCGQLSDSLTDWHTNNIMRLSFTLDQSNFCCSNHLEMTSVWKKMTWKKKIFSNYNHDTAQSVKILVPRAFPAYNPFLFLFFKVN